jgi:hypothetical protein
MKLFPGILAAIVFVWLALWVADTGVLVYSSDTGVLKTRDCRYIIGVSVIKKLEPLSHRCSVLAKVGR